MTGLRNANYGEAATAQVHLSRADTCEAGSVTWPVRSTSACDDVSLEVECKADRIPKTIETLETLLHEMIEAVRVDPGNSLSEDRSGSLGLGALGEAESLLKEPQGNFVSYALTTSALLAALSNLNHAVETHYAESATTIPEPLAGLIEEAKIIANSPAVGEIFGCS